MKRLVLLTLLLLSVLLTSAPTAKARDAGWTRVGDMIATDVEVGRGLDGALRVWTADTIGYSVFHPDGSLRGRFRWPSYGSITSEWTSRLAPAGSIGAVYTIGGCCPAKSSPTLAVMVPSSDATRYVNLAAAFDISRAGNSAQAVAVDRRDRPWVTVDGAVWVMEAGAHTPLTVADDRWSEITRAGGRRIGPVQSIASGPDDNMWLLGRTGADGWQLLQYAAGDAITQTGDFSLPGTTPELKQIVVDQAGTLYLVSADAVRRIVPGGTLDVVVSQAAFEAEINDAAFVNDTLWVATAAGVYRRSTTPSGSDSVTAFGPTEQVGNYVVVPAPGIVLGEKSAVGTADPAGFWYRTDAPVVQGHVSRAFYWGPQDWSRTREPYREAPFGMRRVFYYDKARMEVTNPAQLPVTNGLLVVEMVTGRRQMGDTTFEQAIPATEVVAGDPARDNPNAPTYASFTQRLSITPGQYPERVGQAVTATLAGSGQLGTEPKLARTETRIAAYDTVTGHNVPRIFVDFLNQHGAVFSVQNSSSALMNERIMDPLVGMGHPVTEPYWVLTRVRGVDTWVLTQLFERRVLTYTPGNPSSWRVEMGNVGQHYYAWRYGAQPWERSS